MDELITYVKELLLSTGRDGMQDLVNNLEELEYFSSPSSTRFHCSFPGGLMVHSLSMFSAFDKACNRYGLDVPQESRIIVGLLHDLCKAGSYVEKFTVGGMTYNYNRSRYGVGHAKFSLERIEQYIELTNQEGVLIRFHMGMYGTSEFNVKRAEYSMAELSNAFNAMPETKLFYFCDDMSAQFMENGAMIASGKEWFRPYVRELCRKLQLSGKRPTVV